MKPGGIIFSLAVVAGIGFFSYFSFVTTRMKEHLTETRTRMNESVFECPPGREEKKERWSKLGYSRSCVEPKDGKWEAWSEGYKMIEGSYSNGKKSGRWIHYRADGSISNTVYYRDGVEISNARAINNDN